MALNFSKIKGLFIVPEDEVDTPEKKQDVKKQDIKKEEPQKPLVENKTSFGGSSLQTPSGLSSTKGEFNEQIFNSLTKAISDANLPGEDYLEFVSALQAMKNIELAESVKMQTVLATLSIKGLTVQKIVESADYYLKVLENEKEKFNQAMLQQTSGRVGEKQNEMKTLEETNAKMSEQIQLLTMEIKKNTERIGEIKKEIEEADSKIKATENNFYVTYDYVANQIINNVGKIKNLSN
jgi:hypothetical protein